MYLGIEPTAVVMIVAHRSEMGTGIRTCLPMVVADELDADWARVTIVQALGDVKYGSQNTDGSCSIRDFYEAMREAGATARTMLERAAAGKWGVPVEECRAQQSLSRPRQEQPQARLTANSSPLAAHAAGAEEERPALQDAGGVSLHRQGHPAHRPRSTSVTGKGDVRHRRADARDGVRLDRAPAGARRQAEELRRLRRRRKVAGVQQTWSARGRQPRRIGSRRSAALAVIADNTWAAMQGPRSAEGRVGRQARTRASIRPPTRRVAARDGAQAADRSCATSATSTRLSRKAAKTHEAEYYVPMLAHAPMEPPAAVAEFKDGKVVTFCADAEPAGGAGYGRRRRSASRRETVTCHVTLLGGGFGRKSKPDYVAEAALLSKAGRQAGEGRVEPRRRHPVRLLPLAGRACT